MGVTIKTQDQVRDEILTDLAAGGLTASGPGTVNRTIAEASAQAAGEAYYLLGALLDAFFIDSAAGVLLDARVRDRVPDGRKPGVQATGAVTFSRSTAAVAQITIPAGTTLVTADGTVQFITIAAGVIGVGKTSSTVSVQAVAVGVAGNLAAGTVLKVKGLGIQGVETIAVADPGLSGGVDRETDDELRARYKLELRNPRRSGSVSDYQAWALSVNGVTGATVLTLNRGAGTVDVLITTSGGIPSDQLVADTQAYINSVKPAVDDAQVIKPTGVNVDVTLTLAVTAGYTVAGVSPAVTAVVQDYINGLVVGDDVLVAALVARVMGVTGVVNCQITAPAADVPIDATAKALCGVVGVS